MQECALNGRLPEMKGLYDSHFHLSIMKKKGMDVSSILEDCFARGFRGGIDIGTGIEDFAERKELASPYPSILLSAGMYPSEAAGEWRDGLPALREQCADARVAAVGEIGIDLHWNYASSGEQSALFRVQLEIADDAGLPVIVHCRKSEAEIKGVLKAKRPSRGGVLHCFSADYARYRPDGSDRRNRGEFFAVVCPYPRRGRRISTIVPFFSLLSIDRLPPCASITFFTTTRPSPVPP